MLDRKAIKRALEAVGFVFLRGGWVKREAAPRLQAQVDKAVREAEESAERVKNDCTQGNRVGKHYD